VHSYKSARFHFFMAGCRSGTNETCKHRWVIWIPVFQAHMASKLMNAFKCLLVLKPGKHIELLYKVWGLTMAIYSLQTIKV